MLPINFNKKVYIPAYILHKDLNGEGVILHLESEAYFGLDEVANRMFMVLSTTDSIDAAYRTLLDEFDVEADVLRRDLEAFIRKLVEYGMVEIVE